MLQWRRPLVFSIPAIFLRRRGASPKLLWESHNLMGVPLFR